MRWSVTPTAGASDARPHRRGRDRGGRTWESALAQRLSPPEATRSCARFARRKVAAARDRKGFGHAPGRNAGRSFTARFRGSAVVIQIGGDGDPGRSGRSATRDRATRSARRVRLARRHQRARGGRPDASAQALRGWAAPEGTAGRRGRTGDGDGPLEAGTAVELVAGTRAPTGCRLPRSAAWRGRRGSSSFVPKGRQARSRPGCAQQVPQSTRPRSIARSRRSTPASSPTAAIGGAFSAVVFTAPSSLDRAGSTRPASRREALWSRLEGSGEGRDRSDDGGALLAGRVSPPTRSLPPRRRTRSAMRSSGLGL